MEGLKRILKVEVGSLCYDPLHNILKHFRSAESYFREGVDEPGPLVIIPDFPRYLMEELGSEESIDDEVPKMCNSHSHILIDHFHDYLKVTLLVFLRRYRDDLCQKSLIIRALGLCAHLLHQCREVFLAHVGADLVQSVGEFPHWHYNLEGLATEIYLNRAFPKIRIDVLTK